MHQYTRQFTATANSKRRSNSKVQNAWIRIPTHMLPASNTLWTQRASYSTKRPPPKSSTTQDLPTASHPTLPHLTPQETVHMTSIGHKPETTRLATAVCRITFSNDVAYSLLTTEHGYTKKGDVLSVARIAGIMAAKRTADIVPLAHPGLGITGVEVDVKVCAPVGAGSGSRSSERERECAYGSVLVTSTVHCHGKTGVEMEALTSVLGAALTVFDMCKAVDKGMVIGEARVVRKRGGKSGDWEEGKKVNSTGGNA